MFDPDRAGLNSLDRRRAGLAQVNTAIRPLVPQSVCFGMFIKGYRLLALKAGGQESLILTRGIHVGMDSRSALLLPCHSKRNIIIIHSVVATRDLQEPTVAVSDFVAR
jgi:hypothetical protein